jgi:Fe-S-cluster-containing hydrogenase component 2
MANHTPLAPPERECGGIAGSCWRPGPESDLMDESDAIGRLNMRSTRALTSRATDKQDAHKAVHSVGKGTVRLRVRQEGGTSPLTARPTRYGRRRAISLLIVNVLMVAHFIHWRLADRTLAPLEPSEAMKTLEKGVITAGFVLFSAAILATALFGRFFCGWGCHILALEDACAWLLGKIGVRPKPIRSRLLSLVPLFAFIYMFVWPQIHGLHDAAPAAAWRISTDAEGFGSFVTDDYWRAMPGPVISVLTLLACGFAIVYVLGARSFCQYGCPYGAVFRAADTFAPGRVHLTGDCHQCGHCTAVCNSNVRVHEEVARFGKVVDMACMRDLDCVAACPNEALTFSYSRPPLLLNALQAARRRLRPDFSWLEEGVAAISFIACFFIFRGLYDALPFLFALGWSAMFAYSAWLALRMAVRRDVRFHTRQLKHRGRTTGWGWCAWAFLIGLAGFTAHSGFIRIHEVRADRAYAAYLEPMNEGEPGDPALRELALRRLETVERWGLHASPVLRERMAHLHLRAGRNDDAAEQLRLLVEMRPGDLGARLALAQIHLAAGRLEEADGAARALLVEAKPLTPSSREKQQQLSAAIASAHLVLADIATRRGAIDEALDHLRSVRDEQPDNPTARMLMERLRTGPPS